LALRAKWFELASAIYGTLKGAYLDVEIEFINRLANATHDMDSPY
jgi:hypothetical protein